MPQICNCFQGTYGGLCSCAWRFLCTAFFLTFSPTPLSLTSVCVCMYSTLYVSVGQNYKGDDKEAQQKLVFTIVYVVVWIGSFVVTFNAKLLGGWMYACPHTATFCVDVVCQLFVSERLRFGLLPLPNGFGCRHLFIHTAFLKIPQGTMQILGVSRVSPVPTVVYFFDCAAYRELRSPSLVHRR